MFKYKNDHYDVYIENQLSISPVTNKYVTVDSYEALNRWNFKFLNILIVYIIRSWI